MKINLDGWKKHSADSKHTVLQHADGHQIKVMHSALSPKIRGQLAALPAMAQGGDVEDPTQQHLLPGDKDPNKIEKLAVSNAKKNMPHYAEGTEDVKPVTVNVNAAPPPQQAGPMGPPTAPPPAGVSTDQVPPAEPAPQPNGPQQQAPQQQPAQDAQDDQEGAAQQPSASAAAPAAPQQQAQPQSQEDSDPAYAMAKAEAMPPQKAVHQAMLQDSLKEDTAFQQDLANGHITPETYGQLADKSTFGRLGTMFGLMLGGIGSGITGQPNALLGMMDKAIDRDLNAQMQSKKNAQNLYQLTTQRVLDEAQANSLNVNATATAYARAKAHMNSMALHKFVGMVDALPPGSPLRQQGEQTLALLNNTIQNENYQLLDRAAAASALTSMVGNQTPANAQGTAQAQQEQQWQAQNRALDMGGNHVLAQDLASKHIPNVPGYAAEAVQPDVKQRVIAMNTLDNKVKDLIAYSKAHEGSWSPATRAVAQQKANEVAGFYGSSLGVSQTEGGRTWLDKQIAAKNPTSVIAQELYGSNARLKEIEDSNNMRKGTLLNGLGFPVANPSASSSATSPEIKTDIHGQKWMRGPDGKGIRVK